MKESGPEFNATAIRAPHESEVETSAQDRQKDVPRLVEPFSPACMKMM